MPRITCSLRPERVERVPSFHESEAPHQRTAKSPHSAIKGSSLVRKTDWP